MAAKITDRACRLLYNYKSHLSSRPGKQANLLAHGGQAGACHKLGHSLGGMQLGPRRQPRKEQPQHRPAQHSLRQHQVPAL